MPLRDHFHPPLSDSSGWEALHGGWPMVIAQRLNPILPDNFVAEPRVHLGQLAEIDVAAFERSQPDIIATGDGGVAKAPAVWRTSPSLQVETEAPAYDEYEVRIFNRDRQLVAAIEIVSPGNKDRHEARRAFVGKCAALLRSGVAVSIIDLVTSRLSNLYIEVLSEIGQADPTMRDIPPAIYAASCRWITREPRALLESWSNSLAVGQPLPELPLWLSETFFVPLPLEQSYEQACRDLKIK